MTVGELITELERAPRGAAVRAVLIGRDLIGAAAEIERVHISGIRSVAEGVLPRDVVILACSEAPAKRPVASQRSLNGYRSA